ncbi:MAG TPA: DUF4142 domain-containing protein [Terriglobales bacterium]|nr:DUF4142 domain-containing protein [Terriglobales bacterium]
MRFLLALIFALLGLVIAGSAQQGAEHSMPTGKAFITQAAQINLAEIELGNLAEQKANDQAVKEFGKLMVQDHTQAQDKLKQLASKEDVTLPMQAGAQANELKQRLSSESGAQFDEMYIRHMLSGHKQAIATFENEVAQGKNSAIQNYAESCLPVIQDHIRVAENVAGKMGLSGKNGLSQPDKAITMTVARK